MLTQEPVPSFNSPVTRERTRVNLFPLSAKQSSLDLLPQSSQRAPQIQKARRKTTSLFPREGDSPRDFWETRLVPQGILGLLRMTRFCHPDLGISYQQLCSGLPGLPSSSGPGIKVYRSCLQKTSSLTLKPYHQEVL